MFINNNDIEYIRSILQNSEEWITVKGNHIRLKDGETAKEATQRFIEEKQNKPKGSKVTGYKEYDPENAVKFIKPSFTISEDRHETIKNFKTWYKENLQGKSVENPLLGKVYFYRSGWRESTNKNLSSIENLKYISVIPEIIKTSKDITEEKQKHYHPNVKHLYRVSGFVDNDENIKKISIVILEDNRGNRFYTFDIRERDQKVPAENYRAIDPPQLGMVYNNYNSVNEFELNLYVTETDFRMFEINF